MVITQICHRCRSSDKGTLPSSYGSRQQMYIKEQSFKESNNFAEKLVRYKYRLGNKKVVKKMKFLQKKPLLKIGSVHHLIKVFKGASYLWYKHHPVLLLIVILNIQQISALFGDDSDDANGTNEISDYIKQM